MLATETVAEKRPLREAWQPPELPVVAPLWAWPPRPLDTLRWFVSTSGYLLPWNALFFAFALAVWAYLTPELSRAAAFRIDWIAEVYARNLGLMVLFTGGWHLRLFAFKGQGTEYKYNSDWLAKGNPTFLWGDQLRDNIFWTVASGVTVWTAYEVFMLWSYANGFIVWLDWRTEPVAFALIFLAIPVWREIHGYFVHRLLHWRPLYRNVHYLHHKNVNIGPWTGLAMHPGEHVLYLSAALIFWLVPSHSLMAVFTLLHAALAPTLGHTGFEDIVVKGKAKLATGGYFHYLHHRYFECNYGVPLVPFDKWFGTFHDGSPQAHRKMQENWRRNRVSA